MNSYMNLQGGLSPYRLREELSNLSSHTANFLLPKANCIHSRDLAAEATDLPKQGEAHLLIPFSFTCFSILIFKLSPSKDPSFAVK